MRGRRDPLGHLIWTDGQVTGFERDGDEVRLELLDYLGLTVTVRFTGVTRCEASEDLLVYETMASRTTRTDGGWVLQLRDDDGEVLLEIEYADAPPVRVNDER